MKKDMWVVILVIVALVAAGLVACANGELEVREPEELTAEEPTVEEPTAEEPTAEEPTVEEPTAEEPTVEEPIEEDVEEAPAVSTTRHNPAGIGEVFVIHRETWLDGNSTLELELVALISGDEAWQMVQEANSFNEEPGEGKEYILAKFRVTVLETEEEPFEVSHAMFDAVSAQGKVYGDFVSVAGLDPTLRVELYEGAEHEGWTYFLVDKQDTPVAAFDRGEDSEEWFILRP